MACARHKTILLMLATSLMVGCGLNTAVLQTGGNGCKGVLLNYSCGAGRCDPIDPAKPTIVLTHGWNPLPKRIHMTFASSSAEAIKHRCGDRYNLLSWDWNAVKVSPFQNQPIHIGRQQGRMLAAALRARGVQPQNTQVIGHSLGAIVAVQAARCLSDMGPMAQLTLLEPPAVYHEEIFCKLGATQYARVVENYWAPGISGYGGVVYHQGVQNHKPIRGIVDLSISNHVHVLRWYLQTIRNPSLPNGFQKSVFAGHHRMPSDSSTGILSY